MRAPLSPRSDQVRSDQIRSDRSPASVPLSSLRFTPPFKPLTWLASRTPHLPPLFPLARELRFASLRFFLETPLFAAPSESESLHQALS
mmetsp:Transcript_8051/g.24827  ORF Transcript_8051/g.24827 Transcript_8051/m.24827 type:complete len:89 (+) Transcript_8051:403-669(+)